MGGRPEAGRMRFPDDLSLTFKLSDDGKRYISAASDERTELSEPGLPFSLVFRCEPGKEDVILKIASAYEAASKRRIPPPAFGPIPA